MQGECVLVSCHRWLYQTSRDNDKICILISLNFLLHAFQNVKKKKMHDEREKGVGENICGTWKQFLSKTILMGNLKNHSEFSFTSEQ